MKIKTIIVILTVCVASWILHADYAEEIDMEYLMPLLKSGKTEEAMTYLKEKLHSGNKETRSGAYNVMSNWIFPRNPEDRKEIVKIWSSSLNDIYSSNELYKYLYSASPEYYTETAKQNLINSFERKDNRLDRTILLLGHANVTEAIPQIKEISKSKSKSNEETFVYRQALARMGDQKEIDWCIKYINERAKKVYPGQKEEVKLSEKKIQNQLVSSSKFYAYIRQPETIALLNNFLMSKDSYKPGEPGNAQYNGKAFDALVKSLVIDDVIIKDRFGKYVPNKENIALLQEWMKEHYTPEKIKSLSVLINGQIVNNYASAGTATHEKKHTAPPAKEAKLEVVKAEKKQVPKVKTPEPEVSPTKVEKADNTKYLYLIILAIGIVFAMVLIKRKKK